MRPHYFGTVIFDCDSTLATLEGVEALAGDHHQEITALTEAAMRGAVPLEEIYGRRMGLIAPSRDLIDQVGRAYVASLVPDADIVVETLRGAGVDVRVLSGGLRPAVLAVARHLGVPDDHVAAVDVTFGASGEYRGFDETSPLARAGGKGEVIRRWRPELTPPVMLVGDGATDLEARPDVDCFLAFMGVADRPEVRAGADGAINCLSLAPVLPLVLPDPPADARGRDAWERGRELAPDMFPTS